MRHIAVVTGGRMTYGYSRPVLRVIERDPDLRYSLIVTNQHLLPSFGSTIHEIEEDGFEISDRVYMALDGYTPTTMTKSLGVWMLGVSDAFHRLRPDIVLVVGDRGEHLVAAIVAAHMNIPVGHIQAGELSGNVDGMTRHAIARFAHMHFASNEDAATRLRRSGEQEFRIFLTGAPQLDDLVNGEVATPAETAAHFGLDPVRPLILVAQHPVTEDFHDAAAQMEETLVAVSDLREQTVIIFPNNDAGSESVRRAIERHRHEKVRVERSLPRRLYGGLMRTASVLVGNSSSGLIEAPCFKLPAVNVGDRQRDRVRGNNVIDVPYDRREIRAAIEKALSPEFRAFMATSCVNPYLGDGHVAERIVEVMRTIPIDTKLLKKQMAY